MGLLKGLRQGLGKMIMTADSLCPPSVVSRDDNWQQQVDEQTKHMALYQFEACPFCVKTRRAMRRLNLTIELKDALVEPYRSELLEGGGQIKVPCLQIREDDEVRWLYESDAIISYLEERFG